MCVENDHDDTACGENAYSDNTVCESQLGSDHNVNVNPLVAKPPKFKVEFKDCSVTMMADSGASCSITDEKTFENKFKGIQLEKCSTDKLNAYGGSRIVTIGCFTATIKCGKQVLVLSPLVVLQPRSSVVNRFSYCHHWLFYSHDQVW